MTIHLEETMTVPFAGDEPEFRIVEPEAITVPLLFIDTETTGLNRRTRQIWELAVIRREPDGRRTEFSALVSDVSLYAADPKSLEIGGFRERHPRGDRWNGDRSALVLTEAQVANEMLALMSPDAIWVGAVPWFDELSIDEMLLLNGLPTERYRYHLLDVETAAAGRLQIAPPWDFDALLAAWGLGYDEADRHTALGDARMVERLYDAVFLDGVRP
jgi:hypothetical protein